ncbi:MAG: hypothetical protein KJ556_21370 [Gammaproteobacteria bacterium]|nr:hypothetical protein [Gammaproteobacteria bacterium]
MARSVLVIKQFHTLTTAEKAAGVSRRFPIRNHDTGKMFVRVDLVPGGAINGILVKGEDLGGNLFTLATLNITGNTTNKYEWKSGNILITTPITAVNLTAKVVSYNELDGDDSNDYVDDTVVVT